MDDWMRTSSKITYDPSMMGMYIQYLTIYSLIVTCVVLTLTLNLTHVSLTTFIIYHVPLRLMDSRVPFPFTPMADAS